MTKASFQGKIFEGIINKTVFKNALIMIEVKEN